MVNGLRLIAVLAVFPSIPGLGSTLYVPAEPLTIQGAIDGTAERETVRVAPGEYEITEPMCFNHLLDPVDPESPPGMPVHVYAASSGQMSSKRTAQVPVHVILWFDTEDYILPASDDAAKRIAEILTDRNIRGTFKVVGEKARALERRGRRDVIDALRKHDIAYHTNFHSLHPTVAEYLACCGWADGVAEFIRREGSGARDVRRIFGVKVLSCYGQPGSSFAPQAFAALRELAIAPRGVPCYVDEGNHVGLDGKPFRFCGAITVYHMGANCTRMDLHEEGGLVRGIAAFRDIHRRLSAEGGGLVSIYYHPCEWVHRAFWDGVNFARGANPLEALKKPPQRPAAETEAAFLRYEKYIDFMRSLPGVKFIAASDLPGIYPDPVRKEGLDAATIERLAREIVRSGKADVIEIDPGRVLSAADQFAALLEYLGKGLIEADNPDHVKVLEVLGPSEVPPATEVQEVTATDFFCAVRDVRNALRVRRQIPSPVFVGSKKVAPADFLVACAGVTIELMRRGVPGERVFQKPVAIPRGTPVVAERYVAGDSPGLFGGWVIHRQGFRAPRLVEMTRLQAWTLKPAGTARGSP